MTTYDETDMIEGRIRYRQQGIPTASFTSKAETDEIVAEDMITITNKTYKNHDGYDYNKTIFDGRIEDSSLHSAQSLKTISKLEELESIRPQGTYHGYSECIAGVLVDEYCNTCDVAFSSSDKTIVPNEDVYVTDWTAQGAGNKYEDIDEGISSADGTAIYVTNNTAIDYPDNKYAIFGLESNGLSTSYNYNVYKIDVIVRWKVAVIGILRVYLMYSDDTTTDLGTNLNNTGDYVNHTFTVTDLNLTQDDIDSLRIILSPGTGDVIYYVDTVDVKFYYHYYDDFTKGDYTTTMQFGGDQTLKNILDELSLNELFTWYVDADNYLQFNDGTNSSGISITTSSNISNITGVRQIKKYNTVTIYGGFSGGAQITSTTGSGEPVYEGTFMSITDQTSLDGLRDRIYQLLHTDTPPLKVKFDYINSSVGLLQVGESITVGTGITFSDSIYIIPSGTYTIDEIQYYIDENGYQKLRITLISSLLIEKIKILKGKRQIIQTTNVALDTSTGLTQVAGGESVGQANTGTNVGTDGVGVYSGKSGVTLEFHNIAPASSKITITANGEDIDIDVGTVNINDLGDLNITELGDAEILQYDSGSSKWINRTITEAGVMPSSLNDLTDVTIDGTPANDEILAYDTTGGEWQNQTASEAGIVPTSWITTQHNRVIYPDFFIPQDGVTAGTTNVYGSGSGYVAFGATSYTNDHRIVYSYTLPDDYVDDEDIYWSIWVRWSANGLNNDQVNYQIDVDQVEDGGSATEIWGETSSFTDNFSLNMVQKHTFTIDGTDLDAGKVVKLIFEMEDYENEDALRLMGTKMIVPVAGRE